MSELTEFKSVRCWLDGHVGQVVFSRPPHNFFNLDMLSDLATAIGHLESLSDCRVIVIGSEGKAFCAGAELGSGPGALDAAGAAKIYEQAVRLASGRLPLVAKVQGAAIGGGLGLAAVADFRIAAPEARFVANFSTLGLHAGFGLTALLPAIVGLQKATELLLTAPRLTGEDAFNIGLVDQLNSQEELDQRTIEFAERIAIGAPMAVQSMRRTLREGRVRSMREAIERELSQQAIHFESNDFREGITAAKGRRIPKFEGR